MFSSKHHFAFVTDVVTGSRKWGVWLTAATSNRCIAGVCGFAVDELSVNQHLRLRLVAKKTQVGADRLEAHKPTGDVMAGCHLAYVQQQRATSLAVDCESLFHHLISLKYGGAVTA